MQDGSNPYPLGPAGAQDQTGSNRMDQLILYPYLSLKVSFLRDNDKLELGSKVGKGFLFLF